MARPWLLFLLSCVGCAPAAARPALTTGAPREELAWAPFSAETFARAKAQRKLVVMDGSAEWCHWCHVMEATTYHDPIVRAVLDRHFIAVKVDVDARPDLQERYSDYGWPATVIFSPDADELGKYRGYIAPEAFVEILKQVASAGTANVEAGADRDLGRAASYVTGRGDGGTGRDGLSEEHLGWIAHATDVELDDYWDEAQGGWGRMQKAPLGWNNAWMLLRASEGDEVAKRKVLFTLDQQARLIDPVWGGIYQYSAASDWDHPHFEKLMTFQAPALENYADAFRLTRDPKHLARATAIYGYLERFMKDKSGGFFTTQDADVNAHDRSKPFVDGHTYYASSLSEAARLARGLPRIDTNEYGRENGLAIAAYAAMYDATKDPKVLRSALQAADRILETHRTKRGGVSHGPIAPGTDGPKQLYLADNATFGWGLLRLAEVAEDPATAERLAGAARTVADFMLADLADARAHTGGLFASTKDPDAVGVFATRRVPFEENVMALRMLARLVRRPEIAASDRIRFRSTIGGILRAISTPEEIKGRGRMLGDYLLALEETKGVRTP